MMNCTNEAKLEAALATQRVTLERVKAVIDKAHYWQVPGTTITVCALVCRNGFTVMGQSGCPTKAQFNSELGRMIARDNAMVELRKHECYALRNEILMSTPEV